MSDASADSLSEIHVAAFVATRGWSADEIAQLQTSPLVFTVAQPNGFAMGRVVVDEAELLTVAVAPEAQGHGIGEKLLQDFECTAADRGATRAFLEVADDNAAARALYRKAGWSTCGQRPAYYTRSDGTTCDAILMEKHLT
ncbi:ribosomal protein S18-alanine N-acetyltransferase [uncultured Aliiroseovarius sp.]|uniref:ribosomal protein S18-alanine N-acetyltransferase n=1 Tax=uncultured Aliiroseovarius sp. TaxID=1658783 RepID=UPI002625C8CE|nr:ribosomal protein S18-alanine N-acetyltransferase [uncultured Aliiroseovarius sp.]